MDSKQRTAGPYSVVNGKLFRDGATARIEVKPSEARDMLNSLLQQRDELAAALRLAQYAMRAPLDAWKGEVERKALDAARAALARIDTGDKT